MRLFHKFYTAALRAPENEDGAGYEIDDAAAAVLARWHANKEPAEAKEAPTPTAEDEDPEVAALEADDDTQAPDDTPSTPAALALEDDEAEVVVSGKTLKVAALKELLGAEETLKATREALDADRQKVVEQSQAAVVSLQKQYERAQKAWEPFAKVDLALAAAELPKAAYQALKKDMEAAHANLRFFGEELQGAVREAQEAGQKALREAVEAAHKTVADPQSPHHIPEFSKTFGELKAYATKVGLNADLVAQTHEPAALAVLHKAMKYDAAMAKLKTKKEATKTSPVVKAAPSRTLKPGSEDAGDSKSDALAKVRKTGSVDDAAAALMARWGSNQ